MAYQFTPLSTDASPAQDAPRSMKRVLVVDDDKEILKLLEMFLCRLNYDVASAFNGREALNLFRQYPCDLVITDLQMPVMDGMQLMRSIRSESPQTPVVVITGHLEDDSTAALESAYAVVGKPFRLDKIKSVVSHALSV